MPGIGYCGAELLAVLLDDNHEGPEYNEDYNVRLRCVGL